MLEPLVFLDAEPCFPVRFFLVQFTEFADGHGLFII